MTRKSRTKKRARGKPVKPGWWASMDEDRRRRLLGRVGVCCAVLVVTVAGVVGVRRLENHVNAQLIARHTTPALTFVDVPEPLLGTADNDISDVLSPLLELDWTDDRLCREMALKAGTVGWVKRVQSVRRRSDGRFEIRCVYRVPFAMVQQEDQFVLVDAEGVRLPGSYRYDPAWMLIQGAARAVPEVAAKWEGDDLTAGLLLVGLLHGEVFAKQITAVLLDNFDGRVDPRQTHIELATDRAGGRIRWGSAPGRELEENTVEQKLAILRDVFRRTGRVDGNHAIIDVSTFSDRYIIAG